MNLDSNLIEVSDQFSSTIVLEWNFRDMTKDVFRMRFKNEIQKPLKSVVREFRQNPAVMLPEATRRSIVGLIHSLARYYMFECSRPKHQKHLDVHAKYGMGTPRSVSFLHFVGLDQIREFCLFLVDTNAEEGPVVRFRHRSVQEIESIFSGPAFANLINTIQRGAKPGSTFPLLVSWKITELIRTNCPDTFYEPKIIKIVSKTDLERTTLPASTPAHRNFTNALIADPALALYLDRCCANCHNSGVNRLKDCTRCQVALYCSRECQKKHWKVHKKHCARLIALKREHPSCISATHSFGF